MLVAEVILIVVGAPLSPHPVSAVALHGFRGGVAPADDETIIVLQAVAIDPDPS